jgi:hypothetical protein
MKNIILITFLFFVLGCGYTSVYKDLENKDFQIFVTEIEGDKDINNHIKKQINLYSNKNSINKFDVTIVTRYKKEELTKNRAGSVTDYNLSVNSIFTIYFDGKSKKVTFNENINIKDQTNNFEQDAYEKNIKKNFASSFRQKLISEILSMR